MIRCRFKQPTEDPRPVKWPIKHPYWVTGQGEDYFIIVAYADDEAEVLANWPEATNLVCEPSDAYLFTSRFQRPAWLTEGGPQ